MSFRIHRSGHNRHDNVGNSRRVTFSTQWCGQQGERRTRAPAGILFLPVTGRPDSVRAAIRVMLRDRAEQRYRSPVRAVEVPKISVPRYSVSRSLACHKENRRLTRANFGHQLFNTQFDSLTFPPISATTCRVLSASKALVRRIRGNPP